MIFFYFEKECTDAEFLIKIDEVEEADEDHGSGET